MSSAIVILIAAGSGRAAARCESEASAQAPDSDPSSSRNAFPIFDGFVYKNKPDLTKLGIRSVRIIDRGIWRGSGPDAVPDLNLVREVIGNFPSGDSPVVLDFEQFALAGKDSEVQSSIEKLKGVAEVFRAAAPGSALGYYGVLPIRDYWATQETSGSRTFLEWQRANERLKALEQDADALFPSLYTLYDDVEAWERFAEQMIREARRLSAKPVYPFLWPEYHDSNRVLRGRFIHAGVWRRQLCLMRRLADGIVLWGGYDLVEMRNRVWDDDAEWWSETKAFAEEIQR